MAMSAPSRTRAVPTFLALLVAFHALLLLALVLAAPAWARTPIRSAFFSVYPSAVGSPLDDLPSNADHCGLCHYDFDGGGARNPYGQAIKAKLDLGMTYTQAIQAVATLDSDGDGYTSEAEITDTVNYTNTPTFPGLSYANRTSTTNIPLAEIDPYLTPVLAPDTTPPAVTVNSPNGGESVTSGTTATITYTATDAGGVAYVNIFLSEDGGTIYKPIAKNLAPDTSFSWFVPSLPGAANRIRVQAVDNSGNAGADASNGDFTIVRAAGGRVATTLRDLHLPGTQPLEGAVLSDPELECAACHGNYDPAKEPWENWRGGMMAQAARDPLFAAALAVGEQDAPAVGDLCIRCHSPGGWQEGRSADTGGGLLTANDRHGVQCDFCHRIVDFDYVPGVSPPQDTTVLATVSPLPLAYANGQFINDPAGVRRGPYSDPYTGHLFLQSPIHRRGDLCGTCHDVSNPVFTRTGGDDYALGALDQPHPDMDLRQMFPVERTYSEWSQSAYAAGGVYAPEFAGNKPDGIVSVCQDCHMHDVEGQGCNDPGAPVRPDLALHDLTGGNAFIPDIVDDFFPGEVDPTALAAAKARAVAMLEKAATLEVSQVVDGISVRVTNRAGHKLPSGYPEGRRIWLHVRAVDAAGQQVFESGAYDAGTGTLTDDPELKVYEVHLGLSPAVAQAVGLPSGPSFHFALNDTVYFDDRIPPRGFTNAGFAVVQAAPVGHAYADSQNWDDTHYALPMSSDTVTVTLYYQTLSKEYVEFLRDENVTNTAGTDLYDAWAANGRSAPIVMERVTMPVDVIGGTAVADAGRPAALTFALGPGAPNPFRDATTFAYSLPEREWVRIVVYDLTGRVVRTLVDGAQPPDRYRVAWDGRDDRGDRLASGFYLLRYQAGERVLTRRVTLLN